MKETIFLFFHVQARTLPLYLKKENRQTPWLLVRKQTTPTERPPLVG
jgi:hypothetical protein